MNLSMNFIKANDQMCTFDHHVNAPLFRKRFTLDKTPRWAKITICGLGFYELFVNGKNITKGPLAPYISAPDDLCYFDCYDVADYLTEGENVIGVMLGNGMHNAFGGFIWDFEKASWRSSVKFAMTLTANGRELFSADETFVTHPSPITFDDLRMGCWYDANLELPGWSEPGFDDSSWQPAQSADAPRGTPKLCEAEPIAVSAEIKPVNIFKCTGGYIYDFGVNTAGVCRLKINGRPGQKITMTHVEILMDKKPYLENISFVRPESWDIYQKYNQKDVYICRGGEAEFVPSFTYHGFQYVFVEGLSEDQATKDALTYLEMHSDLPVRGSFSCSDSTVNKLYEMAHRSDLANFYYFPTDCPHREKNGWTGDASMSAEHMLQWLGAEKSFAEWLANIRACQREDGAVPGIVPTGGWGFEWGNGPAWDSVIVNLPYYTYQYTGDKKIIIDNASMIMRYLHYATTQFDERGLLTIGLGDWLQPMEDGTAATNSADAPLELTDSAIVFDMANKASFLFEQVGLLPQARFAAHIAGNLLNALRINLMDPKTCTAAGNCQTSQALFLALGLFKDEEIPQAKQVLLDMIHKKNDHLSSGMIGLRYLFHVLSALGESELAYAMITNDTYPGYGQWVKDGATTLYENFEKDLSFQEGETAHIPSLNHHFLGDIASWFVKSLAGLRFNPNADDVRRADVCPSFVDRLAFVKAEFTAPDGKISVGWKRADRNVDDFVNKIRNTDAGGAINTIVLSVTAPETIHGQIVLPKGYSFLRGGTCCDLEGGTYTIVKDVE